MQVASSFDFDGELRRIALAQQLVGLPPGRLRSAEARLRAYEAAGLGPVTPRQDADALRRHALRLRAFAITTGEAA